MCSIVMRISDGFNTSKLDFSNDCEFGRNGYYYVVKSGL